MSIVLLNIILGLIGITIAVLLTIIAIVAIIVSLVRASNAKKKGKKTAKVGLWIGIAMLLIPWLFIGFAYIASKIFDSNYNRWDVSTSVIAEAVIDEDSDALYDMMANTVIEDTNLTEDGIEEFLDRCDLDLSKSDLKRLSDRSTEDSHYRTYISRANGRNQMCFQFTMNNLKVEGDKMYIAGVDGDAKDKDAIGIYYIYYMVGDEYIEIGEKPPKE